MTVAFFAHRFSDFCERRGVRRRKIMEQHFCIFVCVCETYHHVDLSVENEDCHILEELGIRFIVYSE